MKTKKQLVQIIENCESCPFKNSLMIDERGGIELKRGICNHPEGQNEMLDFKNIPESCPLQDYKKSAKAKSKKDRKKILSTLLVISD